MTLKKITLIIIVCNLAFIIKTQAQCHIDDWTGLKAIYEATNGDNWINRNGWDTVIDNQTTAPANCDLSELYGIFLDNDNRVTRIELDGFIGEGTGSDSNNLSGTIPPEISSLTNLQELYLSGNSLEAIPAELGNLVNLVKLDLSSIYSIGGIPTELGNLINLVELNLSRNIFTGSSIPAEIGNLSNLEVLILSYTNISGSIPAEIGNLSNLKELDFRSNELSGNIPTEIGNLGNLLSLKLSYNQLSGPIPNEIGNLNNLETISITHNQLSGSLPPELGNLSNLKDLYLYKNQLTGNIPPEIGNLSSLEYLYIDQNQFSGSIPPELGNLSNLVDMIINRCELDGSIPPELGNLNNLARLHLAGNQLSGSIPAELGNIDNLFLLSLFDNQLTGSIPEEFGNLDDLVFLNLFDNQMSGCYPVGMSSFCSYYSSGFTNEAISNGNSFDASWEEFCETAAGSCAICSQSINLNAGWNLISFNNRPDNNTVTSVFANLQADNLEFVTGFDNGAKTFDPNQPTFFNTLQTIDDGFGYWVKLTNADVLTAQGGCISDGFRKPMDVGWNLIAYPPIAPQSPSTYFADLIADGSLEFVAGFDGGIKTFDPTIPDFFNSLQQMENGYGYWIKVTNATAKTASNLTNVFSFVNGTSNLPIGEQVAIVNETGKTIASIDVIEDGYLMTTPIYGDDETTTTKEYIRKGENLRFSWNGQTINHTTIFKGDYGIEKVHLEFKLENSLATNISVFPNPIADKANIFYNLKKADNISIVLFNASGKQISSIVENQIQKAGQHQVPLNANDLPTGVYYLQLQNKENYVIEKLVISK